MDIKQVFDRIKTAIAQRINGYRSRAYYKNSISQGHCPTVEEIRNEKVKSLANRLKAGKDEETLTNVLEWQERNLSFWHERHPIATACQYSLFGSGITIGIGLIVAAVLIVLNVQTLAIQVFCKAIFIAVAIFGGSIITFVTICWMIRSNRKIPLRKGLKDVFMPSMSINAFLENRLGVCRDYAKLTVCLLMNIFPESEIYLASAPGHVATGIKIGNELYMLDQRLPILTIGKWKDYRRQKRRQQKKLEKLTQEFLEKVDNPFPQRTTTPLNTQTLAAKMIELLEIGKNEVVEPNSVINVRWKKGAIMYEDDRLVNYSLARLLKLKIFNELQKPSQVTGIEVNRQQKDLYFVIHFKK